MGTKHFLLLKSSVIPNSNARAHTVSSSQARIFIFITRSKRLNFLASYPKPISPIYHRASGYCYTPYAIPRPINGVDLKTLEKEVVDRKQLMILRQKLEEIGIEGSNCMPGQYNGLICPKCKGGDSEEKSLSLHIKEDGDAAMWTCFRAKCRWRGTIRELSEEILGLEPLCDELVSYFAKRKISGETLRRNGVMQKGSGDKKSIAFTYRRKGMLVGCKYLQLKKRFWQEKDMEKILYGLNDIAEADAVIIVEGEIDKLSMEEAGYCNCVSVPNGAPRKVSLKRDTGFQYLWNCKDYLDKASRIILATDGDVPGQALAKELACRLGRERCWHVRWPKIDELRSFKDANEVLVNLGADALRDVIDKAELYEIRYLN